MIFNENGNIQMNIVYHGSPIQGLDIITPHVSTHHKSYVYATKNYGLALIFSVKWDDFDILVSRENQNIVLRESYKDSFRKIFKNKSGSIYHLPATTFKSNKTSFSSELVSEKSVKVLLEDKIDDIYNTIMKTKDIILIKYSDNKEYREFVQDHIKQRLISWKIVNQKDEDIEPRIWKYHGNLINELRGNKL